MPRIRKARFVVALGTAVAIAVGWLLLHAQPEPDAPPAIHALETAGGTAPADQTAIERQQRSEIPSAVVRPAAPDVVERLLFVPGASADAALTIRRARELHEVAGDVRNDTVLQRLLADAMTVQPRLTNSIDVLAVLLAGGVAQCRTPTATAYVQAVVVQLRHREIQDDLRIVLEPGVQDDALALVTTWHTLSPTQLEARLRQAFERTPRLAALLAATILRDSLTRSDHARERAVATAIASAADPVAFSSRLLAAFSGLGTRSDGAAVDSAVLAGGQLLASELAVADAKGQHWADTVLQQSGGGSPADPGSMALRALVAATSPDNALAIPTLQALLQDTASPGFADLLLTNLGRVADAATIVAVASRRGIVLDAPATDDDGVVLQSGLATALVNTLQRHPQDAGAVAARLQVLLDTWRRDARCGNHLQFLLDSLQALPLPTLAPLLRELASSDSAGIAAAATRVLDSWKLQ